MSTWSSCRAVDLKSGKELWKKPKQGGPMVVSGGKLYVFAYPREILCLDPASGAQLWKADFGPEAVNQYNNPFAFGGTLVVVKPTKTGHYGLKVDGYSLADGSRKWSFEPKGILRRGGCFMGEVFGAGELIWVHAVVDPDPKRKNAGRRPSAWIGLDPASGEVRKRLDDETSDEAVSKMLANGTHRCNRGRATERGYFFGTYEFFEWSTGKYHTASFTRSHCGVGTGIMPANGLVYAPPSTCVCRNFIQRGGFMALARRSGGVAADDGGRLERGSGRGSPGTGGAGDWPCYRRTSARDGASAAAVPESVSGLWEAEVGHGPTAPVVSAGRVFLAAGEDHRVVALDALSGKGLWTFTADGRIDSPPTVSGGLVLFGCRDGRIYCLSAADGRLVWRFRAAPLDELVAVDGQLESAWPVHGSVPVVNGVAYCAAGWHTGLDGGVTIYALRAASGDVVWKRHLERLPGGAKADVPVALLTSDGKNLYMGRRAFDLGTGKDAAVRGSPPVMSFGISSFRDSDWAQFSNTKGRHCWKDGRGVTGELLASAGEVTFGVAVKLRGDNGVLVGVEAYKLFAKKGRKDADWSTSVQLIPRALVPAGGTLFAAGVPDPVIPELKDIKDSRRMVRAGAELSEEKLLRSGGELWVLSAADGKKLRALDIGAEPVFDGLAAAGGRLYLSCLDGKLRCFGKK